MTAVYIIHDPLGLQIVDILSELCHDVNRLLTVNSTCSVYTCAHVQIVRSSLPFYTFLLVSTVDEKWHIILLVPTVDEKWHINCECKQKIRNQ